MKENLVLDKIYVEVYKREQHFYSVVKSYYWTKHTIVPKQALGRGVENKLGEFEFFCSWVYPLFFVKLPLSVDVHTTKKLTFLWDNCITPWTWCVTKTRRFSPIHRCFAAFLSLHITVEWAFAIVEVIFSFWDSSQLLLSKAGFIFPIVSLMLLNHFYWVHYPINNLFC